MGNDTIKMTLKLKGSYLRSFKTTLSWSRPRTRPRPAAAARGPKLSHDILNKIFTGDNDDNDDDRGVFTFR